MTAPEEDTAPVGNPASRALTVAIDLARHGYFLTPVTVSRKADGKKAARFHRPSWKAEGDVSNDPDVIRAWWVDHPDTSFALVCGPSGVEGVDLDVKPDKGIDAVTWWAEQSLPMGSLLVETPSGGLHLIWKRRADGRGLPNRAGQLRPGVDTRNADGVLFAAGGYIVGEPGSYTIQGPLPHAADLAETPDAVLELFPRDKPKSDRLANGEITRHTTEWIHQACQAQLDRVAGHSRAVGGFRHLLMGAGMVYGRAVEAELVDRAAAVDQLRKACAQAWGCVDAEDEQWIQDGLRDGPILERWRVREDLALIDPHTGLPDLADVLYEQAERGALDDDDPDDDDQQRAPTPLHLPAEFWEARPSLRHIRDAARSWYVSPDAVLGVALARQSAYVHPGDTVDLYGNGNGAALPVFTINYGPPGVGKGQATRCGAELLPIPAHLTADFRERSIGSGEGLIEAYYGMVPDIRPDGTPSKTKTRKQVRENVLFVLDEGEALVKMMARSGATVAQTIRSAWSGENIGQANATAERDRQLLAGSYSMGMVVNFQPTTIGALFDADQVGGGTPHRFLFFKATDPNAPDDLPEWPGPLPVKDPDGQARYTPWPATTSTTYRLIDDTIRRQIIADRRALLLEQATISEQDTHAVQLRGRVAAHLSRWDGRTDTTAEDWHLAGIVLATSAAVRDAAIQHTRNRAAAEAEERSQSYVQRELRTDQAKAQAAEQREQKQVARGAVVLARRVLREQAEGSVSHQDLRDAAGSRHKAHFADSLDIALTAGWITKEKAGRGVCYRPGPRSMEVAAE